MIDKTLPLIDLHRHLDRSIRLETILDLSQKHLIFLFPRKMLRIEALCSDHGTYS